MRVIILILFSLSPFFTACTSDMNTSDEGAKSAAKTGADPAEPCKFGSPRPMFSDQLPGVTQHQFQSNGQKSGETLALSNGYHLELLQDGCNEIRQEFQFVIKEDLRNLADSTWFLQAIEKMSFLAKLSTKHAPLGFWGRAIEGYRSEMSLGMPKEVEKNTFITIDRLVAEDQATLILLLESK